MACPKFTATRSPRPSWSPIPAAIRRRPSSALAPLVAGQHIDLKDIIVDSKSGVSGAGRTPKLTTHFPECNESVSAYSVGQHRHTPEIEQVLSDVAGDAVEVIFTPHLIPMDRGIFTTIYAAPAPRLVTKSSCWNCIATIMPRRHSFAWRNRLPATKDAAHTNFLDLTVRVVRGRIVVLACEDNLVRGASGVAVQNFNRMFGHPETALWIGTVVAAGLGVPKLRRPSGRPKPAIDSLAALGIVRISNSHVSTLCTLPAR